MGRPPVRPPPASLLLTYETRLTQSPQTENAPGGSPATERPLMRQLLNVQAVRSAARVGAVVAALVVSCVVTATPAQAQSRAKVTIDFAFVAGGTAMEAGVYDIEASRDRIILRSTSGKLAQVAMAVITRLGRHDNDPDPELIFDKISGKLYLSEFWFPDMDGYLVLNTPTDHEHRVLGGSRPHK